MKTTETQDFFITGTDTDAGKTIVTAGLLRFLQHHNVNCTGMKPIQTGCEKQDGTFSTPDFDVYRQALKRDFSTDELELMVPYRYEPPCSPHLAAEQSGITPSLDVIEDHYRQLSRRYDSVLVEGAGGILVPLDGSHSMLDLVKQLAIPVIIVVDNKLGMINHSLLTVEVLRSHGVNMGGYVLTNTSLAQGEVSEMIRRNNRQTIEAFGNIPVLAEIPYIDGFDTAKESCWQQVDQALDTPELKACFSPGTANE